MMQPVLVEGAAALDVIIASYAPKLSETWPGDEQLVGLLIQERTPEQERTSIVWAPRERVLADLTQRRDRDQDARRRARFEAAVAALTGPRALGKVSLVVSGWGDLVTVELEAEDLRTGKLFTTWDGGSA
jgi:hypothetical protein